MSVDVVGCRLLVGHASLGCGNDGDTQALEDAGQLIGAGVNPQAGLGHAAQAGDDLPLPGEVLEGNAESALGAVLDDLEGLEMALIQEQLGAGLLPVGSMPADPRVLGRLRIPDTGQHLRLRTRGVRG